MSKFEIRFSHSITNKIPEVRLGVLHAKVNVVKEIEALNEQLEKNVKKLEIELQTQNEKEYVEVSNSRKAYKTCGKEPSRYRPSAEALLKRIRTGKGLYRINNVVDTINLLSIETHFSIGGFNSDKIEYPITLDIGDANDYEAIGRGLLNIKFMPGLRDAKGFFGTPTSDSVRTMVTEDIENLLLVFYDFGGDDTLEQSLEIAAKYIREYCDGEKVETRIVIG